MSFCFFSSSSISGYLSAASRRRPTYPPVSLVRTANSRTASLSRLSIVFWKKTAVRWADRSPKRKVTIVEEQVSWLRFPLQSFVVALVCRRRQHKHERIKAPISPSITLLSFFFFFHCVWRRLPLQTSFAQMETLLKRNLENFCVWHTQETEEKKSRLLGIY